MWWTRHNFITKFVPFLEGRLCNIQSIIVTGNSTISLDQSWVRHCHLGWISSICEHISQMNNFLGCGAGVDWLAENRERYLLLEQVWLWEIHWNFSVQPLWWSALAAIQNSLFRASEWFIVEWYKRCQFQIMNLFLKYFD